MKKEVILTHILRMSGFHARKEVIVSKGLKITCSRADVVKFHSKESFSNAVLYITSLAEFWC